MSDNKLVETIMEAATLTVALFWWELICEHIDNEEDVRESCGQHIDDEEIYDGEDKK